MTCHIPYNKFCIALLALLFVVAPHKDGQSSVTTRGGATLTVGAGTTFTARGDFNIGLGSIVHNEGTISVGGSWHNLGGFNDRTGIVIMDGGSNCITGYNTFNKLKIESAGVIDIPVAGGTQKVWNELTLTSGVFDASGDSLVLLSDALGTARVDEVTGGSMKGDFTMQRYIEGDDGWRLLGSPVFEAPIEGWNDDFAMSGFPGTDDPLSSFKSIWKYDETHTDNVDSGWAVPSTTGNLMGIGEGFMVWVGEVLGDPIAMTIDLKDSLVSGTQAVSVTYTDGPEDDTHDGWNLIANPYASDILWDDVTLSTSITGFAYLYDPDQKTHISFDQSAGRSIPSHQAFWVKVTGGPTHTATVTFDEIDKTADGNNFWKTSNTNEIRMTLSGYGAYNSSKVRFNSNGSTAYDPMLDAFKLGSTNPEYASLSSITSEGYDMETNTVPDDYMNFAIPLRIFWSGSSQPSNPGFNLTLSIDTLPASLSSVCLEDLLTGEMTELTVGAQYNFYSVYEQAPAPRFMLRGSASDCITSLDDMDQSAANKITILSSNDNLHIYFNLGRSSNAEVNVYDMLGRKVYGQATTVKNGLVDIKNPLQTAGTYLISVVTDEITVSKKVVIGL